MKRGLACCLFVVAFAALLRPASAQEVAAPTSAAVVIDSIATAAPAPSTTQVPSAPSSFAGRVTVGVSPVIHSSTGAQAQDAAAEGGIKNFFFGSRRRTSNTLMIGGAVVAGIGVGVVKGEVGAILGVLGVLSSVGGLYLAF